MDSPERGFAGYFWGEVQWLKTIWLVLFFLLTLAGVYDNIVRKLPWWQTSAILLADLFAFFMAIGKPFTSILPSVVLLPILWLAAVMSYYDLIEEGKEMRDSEEFNERTGRFATIASYGIVTPVYLIALWNLAQGLGEAQP